MDIKQSSFGAEKILKGERMNKEDFISYFNNKEK
jgi:hypothetical protein